MTEVFATAVVIIIFQYINISNQINRLCALNLYTVIYQLHLQKKKKKNTTSSLHIFALIFHKSNHGSFGL